MKKHIPALALLAIALPFSGCVVADDQYEAAKHERDSYRDQVQELRMENDHLNLDIARVYAENEIMSQELAVSAASAVNREMVADLLAPKKPAKPTGTSSSSRSSTRRSGSGSGSYGSGSYGSGSYGSGSYGTGGGRY